MGTHTRWMAIASTALLCGCYTNQPAAPGGLCTGGFAPAAVELKWCDGGAQAIRICGEDGTWGAWSECFTVDLYAPDMAGPPDVADSDTGTSDSSSDAVVGTEVEVSQPQDIPAEDTMSSPPGMVALPGGSFLMGCVPAVDVGCSWKEHPLHKVTVEAFAIDRTEVTQDEYLKCLDAGDCKTPSCSWSPDATPTMPVRCVNWSDALDYCQWRDARLPTEAEWEYAARMSTGRTWPWGDGPADCSLAVMDDGGDGCGTSAPSPVCSRSPAGDTAEGICDMSGNVREWVNDWYADDYYLSSPVDSPAGPVEGTDRSIRGGGYVDSANGQTTFVRYFAKPLEANGNLGFRCARTL